MHKKIVTSANKADPVADALEALTGYEWRKHGEVYECRLNHTNAKVIRDDLADAHVDAVLEVSAARSGRYLVTVQESDGPQLMNAASRIKKAK